MRLICMALRIVLSTAERRGLEALTTQRSAQADHFEVHAVCS